MLKDYTTDLQEFCDCNRKCSNIC